MHADKFLKYYLCVQIYICSIPNQQVLSLHNRIPYEMSYNSPNTAHHKKNNVIVFAMV